MAQACLSELDPLVIMFTISGGVAFAFSVSEPYGNGPTTTLFRNEVSVPGEVLALDGPFYAFDLARCRVQHINR